MARWSRTGFEVVIPFRGRQLRLASNLSTLAEAVEVARRFRAERRHNRDALTILEVATGVVRQLAELEGASLDSTPTTTEEVPRRPIDFDGHVARIRALRETLVETRRLASELSEVIRDVQANRATRG